MLLILLFAGINLLTFMAYYFDKNAAIKNQRRTPETTLLLLGLMGGWLGAFLAQQSFKHKTRKMGFQIVFWITVTVNLSVTAWLWML